MGILRDTLSGVMQQQQQGGFSGNRGWASGPSYGGNYQQQQQSQGYQQQGYQPYGQYGYQQNYYNNPSSQGYGYNNGPPPSSNTVAPPLPPRRQPSPYGAGESNPPSYQTANGNGNGNGNEQQSSLGAEKSLTPTDSASPPPPPLSRPIALPQIDYGDASPFVRGYSSEMERLGIDQGSFLHFVDAINVSIIPNAEAQIVNKAAGLAGWFVPGAGGIALGVLQAGAQIGGAIQLKSATANCLARANQEMFNPLGLEVLIVSSQDLDCTVGQPVSAGMSQSWSNGFGMGGYPSNNGFGGGSNSPGSFGASYMQRLQSYGSLIAPLTTILPPLQNSGRNDLSAQFGARLSSKQQAKAWEKAQKDLSKGKGKKAQSLEKNFHWLLIRQMNTLGQQY